MEIIKAKKGDTVFVVRGHSNDCLGRVRKVQVSKWTVQSWGKIRATLVDAEGSMAKRFFSTDGHNWRRVDLNANSEIMLFETICFADGLSDAIALISANWLEDCTDSTQRHLRMEEKWREEYPHARAEVRVENAEKIRMLKEILAQGLVIEVIDGKGNVDVTGC
jgi:hypothetical protein